jgi:hypothetical protein
MSSSGQVSEDSLEVGVLLGFESQVRFGEQREGDQEREEPEAEPEAAHAGRQGGVHVVHTGL